MKKSSLLFSMFAMTSIASIANESNNEYLGNQKKSPKKQDPVEIEKQKKITEDKICKCNGLKEFFYGNNSIWASNKKVADKKAKKRGYI